MENKIPYQAIQQITNNYDEDKILGRGGFGTVYKGVHEGETVAVKVFDGARFDDSEFRKEFDNLKRLKHPNIVGLLGFCNDTEEVFAEYSGKQVTAEILHTALCLEYVQNGHLGNYISDESTGLHWHTRYKIIKGVCDGLKYLREGTNPILHLDLKPENILLDEDMIPKVADFGLSRLFGDEKTKKTASTQGTLGYAPPEYRDFQVISEKFDIYSLGVIMVKIITGRDQFFRIAEMPQKQFVNQVHDNWRKRLSKVIPPGSLEVYCQQVKRCIELAFVCMKMNRHERPTIQQIVSTLIDTEKEICQLGLNIEQIFLGEPVFPKIDTAENPTTENKPDTVTREMDQDQPTTMIRRPKQLPLEFLRRITDGFSDNRKLSEHAYGEVFKGIWDDGLVDSVVRFTPDSAVGRDRDFTKKIQTLIAVLKHENVVKIVAYCREAQSSLVRLNDRYIAAQISETLLCHEYFAAGSLAEYIDGESCLVNWNMSFKIIMGICQGLHFLHTELHTSYIHTDLKPQNIYLDNHMVPKIWYFGQFQHDEKELTPIEIPDVVGLSTGYFAPEYLENGEISCPIDIYSLGIIILKIMAGGRNHHIRDHKDATIFIKNVRENWTDEYIMSMYPTQDEYRIGQVKICIAMGLECVEVDQRKRPSIVEIVHRLNILSKEELLKHELLEVQPRELCFPFEQRKSISCSLQLRNTGDDHVAFMLVAKTPNRYLTKLPLCGILPHRCTYTHTITMHQQEQLLPLDSGEFFRLQTVALGKFDLQDLDKGSIAEEYKNFFTKATEVQEVKLKVTCDPPDHQEPTRSNVEVITRANARQVSSIDVHSTEPWIMTTSTGSLHVWNYKTMKKLSLLEEDIDESVHVAKFVKQEKWLVVGDTNGGIHVYSYKEQEREQVKFFRAHDSKITSLALHPTRPFLLSSSDDADNLIKLWDWEKNWQCRTFEGHANNVMQVTFNSKNLGCFTSASLDGTVKIWYIDYDDGDIVTWGGRHFGRLLCVDNFERDNRLHLIAGSMDGTAQIWNTKIEGEGCVQRLEGHGGRVSAVNLHPELPMLITGSFDGTVRLWNSDTYKLDDIYNFNLGEVYAFGFIKDPKRIVVGCQRGTAIMEISVLNTVHASQKENIMLSENTFHEC